MFNKLKKWLALRTLNVNTVELNENDVIMVHVGIGKLEGFRAERYMNHVKDLFYKALSVDNNTLFLPIRNGDNISVTIINKK